MKRVVVALVIAAAAVGALWAATLSGAGFTCEACVRFQGREACKSATGAAREEAERAAIATACALVANGVTATIGCQGLVPTSLACTQR